MEQVQPERWWEAYLSYVDANGEPGSRELGTFLTKQEAMDRVEQEFEQAPGPPCRVLVKDGQKVVRRLWPARSYRQAIHALRSRR
jgi:hypothetical protein